MSVRPSGTVTFLFTDAEGSTALWEQHPDEMRVALERHDEILRSVIQSHDGYVFSTAGDAFAAAFSRAGDAVAAAVEAQRSLSVEPWPGAAVVRVRMGLHTGEAQERDGDYFGPALNRAARVMAAGHGGQILVAVSTAALVDGLELVDLGEHRLKDLAAVERLFQVRAEGLDAEFAALRTVDEVPGNLTAQSTSFVGRQGEVKELTELVRAHRLVTLTGVGGVGKTRLAIQVAAEVAGEFGDGVWLIELAPVGDPAAVPDAVAMVLGINPQAGLSVTASVVRALSGRRLLIVLDNCEHVLDAAADLVEAVLAGTDSVTVLATSREGLRVGAEQLWPVPSLDVGGGASSAAVSLFVERARSVNPAFEVNDVTLTAVVEICERLDGIALGIELAAARMVSMSAQDIRDRLDDRFRLLAGSRRGLERHQTLRHAVGWSFDLLDDDERAVLQRCAVFAGGFDLASAAHLCDELDEYAVLDVLDSLVRKSLVTVDNSAGHARYGMLETIRQYAEEQLSVSGNLAEIRDRHAAYFAVQAQMYWAVWNGPDQLNALNWVDAEFANLRAGYAWAVDRGDLVCGAAIAAHTAMMAQLLMRFESVDWTEQILDAATTADIAQLPRLYTAASVCLYTGRADAAIGHARRAVALEADTRYDPFEPGWSCYVEAVAHLFAGHVDPALEIIVDLTAQPGLAHVLGLAGSLTVEVVAGRAEWAIAVADEAEAAARAHGSPWLIALVLYGAGRAFNQADPHRALRDLTEGLVYSRAHRLPILEAMIAREAAGLEAVHGDLDTALALFDTTIDSQSRGGNVAHLVATVAGLAVLFDRLDRAEIAATIYGTTTRHAGTALVIGLPETLDHLLATLGDTMFDDFVATGAAMEPGEAVHYIRAQIQAARSQLPSPN